MRWRDITELLGSMRFAISLLVIICIASIAGTVLPQNMPRNTYLDQFGPFWAGFFESLSLFNVYNAWWFLLIMAFLVVSTSLCVLRNAPSMVRDTLSFRDKVREGSWRSFPHRTQGVAEGTPEALAEQTQRWLRHRGFSVRIKANGDSRLVAAKAGAGNRYGYIAAHLAIVIICVGGLFDSELPIRMQVWLGGKVPIFENMRIADVPSSGVLNVDNPSFRASALIPEGAQTRNSVVMVGDGALVQPLPFSILLREFQVDYYSTGMPSDFASHVTITDLETREEFDTVIRVNKPFSYRGVTVYQSSFDDGGSHLSVQGYDLNGSGAETFTLDGTVGDVLPLELGAGASALQFNALRPINVENIEDVGAAQPLALGEHVAAVTGSAARDLSATMRNVGPSIEYQLIDEAGQTTEFHNYMLPVTLDGMSVFLLGTRANPNDPFRYLRIPADERMSLEEFMALRSALANPEARQTAAERFADYNLGAGATAQARQSVVDSSARALDVFAAGGLQGLTGFLEDNVPADELEKAAAVVIRLLGGSLTMLRDVAREELGLPPVAELTAQQQEQADLWTRHALAALSDLTVYPAPVFFMLRDFDHVEASVFQLNRSPGQWAVYLGCVLLILGVFAMFYVRERRLWVWIRPENGGSRGLMAMTSQRRNMDFKREFNKLRTEFGRLFREGSE